MQNKCSMIHQFREIVYLEDVDGHARHLQGCSLNNLPKLASLLTTISERINKSQHETIGDLWIADLFWRELVSEALRLVGLCADWFTPSMLSELLFPFDTKEGQCPGLIMMVCFPKVESESPNETGSIDEYRLQQLNNLVGTGLTPDLHTALGVADSLSGAEIDRLIENVVKAQKVLAEKDPNYLKNKEIEGSEKLADELYNNPAALFDSFNGSPTLGNPTL